MDEGMYRLIMVAVGLDAPWCYVVAGATIVVAFLLLAVLEPRRARADA
ncbi:hypothetical protein ACFTSF_19120 [Kribbella sp. NPDC056951]